MNAKDVGPAMNTESTVTPIQIPATLSPADAEDLRVMAMEALRAASDTTQTTEVVVEEYPCSPCALQMFVATQRSAETMGISLTYSGDADALLADMQQQNGAEND